MATPPPIKDIKHHWAGVFLVTESGKVVGQLRDDKPGIDNPGKVGIFSGKLEPGENPRQAAYREIVQEETNLTIAKDDIIYLQDITTWRELTGEWQLGHLYYAHIKEEDLASLEVYEGQGWAYITGPDDSRLIDAAREPLKCLLNRLNL